MDAVFLLVGPATPALLPPKRIPIKDSGNDLIEPAESLLESRHAPEIVDADRGRPRAPSILSFRVPAPWYPDRYFAASILSTLMTPVFGNRVPVTFTF